MNKRIFLIIIFICVVFGIIGYPFIPKKSSGIVMQLSQIKGWDEDNISNFVFHSGNEIHYRVYKAEPRRVRSYVVLTRISPKRLEEIIQKNINNGLHFELIQKNKLDQVLTWDDFAEKFYSFKSEVAFSKLASVTINAKNREGNIVIYYDSNNEIVYCKIYTSGPTP
jgi:hypothetical protein